MSFHSLCSCPDNVWCKNESVGGIANKETEAVVVVRT